MERCDGPLATMTPEHAKRPLAAIGRRLAAPSRSFALLLFVAAIVASIPALGRAQATRVSSFDTMGTAAQAAATPPVSGQETPRVVDLAWIALTPPDLAQPGYAQEFARAYTLTNYATYLTGGKDKAGAERMALALREAGWERAYASTRQRPSANDPEQHDRAVESIVSRCADEASAARTLGLLRMAAIDLRGFAAVPLPGSIGDEAVLLRKHSTTSLGGPADSLRLLVRDGPFLFDLLIIDWTNTQPPAAEALQLAAVLQDRLREVRAGTSPGLSGMVYRLDRDDVTGIWEGYRRRGGEQMAWSGQAPERFAAMDAYYRGFGVIDLYRYSVVWRGWARYAVDVLRFASDAEAAAQMRELARQETATDLGTPNPIPPEVREVMDMPPLGDDSLFVRTTVPASELTREPMYVAWVRVGDRIAEISLVAFDATEADIVRLAEGEVRCLQTSECWDGTGSL